MENKFFKNPFIVYHINPYKPEYNHKLIFIWNCPPLIKNKILNNQFDDVTIKNYFGPDYKKKLGLETYDNNKNVFHENFHAVSNINSLITKTGGDISDNDLIIKSTRDDDIENYTTSDNINDHTSTNDINFNIDFNKISTESDVDELVDILDTDVREGNEYIFDYSVYPEDTIITLKNKIYSICKIPIYRQFLFYSGLILETFHTIHINNMLYNLSPSDDLTKIHNIGVDKKLYLSRDTIKVKSYEEFKLVGDLKYNYITLIDLKSYSDILGINKIKILDDKLFLNIVYYGFIKKYFPMLNFEAFKQYLNDESVLLSKYPLLIENIETLNTKFMYEKSFLDYMYTMKIKEIKDIEQHIELAAKSIKLGNIHNSNLDIFNMRNIFDIIVTNPSIVKVISKFEFNDKIYEITKEYMNLRYDKNVDINFELYNTYLKYKNNGLVLYYCYDKTDMETKIATFVLFPTGKYYIIIDNKEVDKKSFNKTIELGISIVNKIIKILNENISIILNKNISNFSINYLTKNSIKFYTLDIIMYLNVSLSSNKFNKYKIIFNDLNKYGILTLGNIQTDNQILSKINKSIYEYGDRKFIVDKDRESSNYYDAYLDAGANAIWKLLFNGKKLNITNSITRVSYEMFNLIPEELNYVYHYIITTIHMLDALKSTSDYIVNNKKNYIAKSDIKKLEELDPELYAQNLGKNKIYSRIVQKKNRPAIYSIDEYNKMSNNDKNNMVKYWNFTTNKPIYYKCENSSYKHFSFVTGKHPKGYCFPVCRNIKNKGTKMSKLFNTCMSEHSTDNNTKISENILKYKDSLLINKKYYFPDQLNEFFYKLDQGHLYFNTITPSYNNVIDTSLFNIYVDIIKVEPSVFIRDIIKKLKQYNILDFETLNIYFNSIEDLCNSLELHFIKKVESYESYWNSIFEEILLYIYNVCIISITYDTKLFLNIRQDINNFKTNKFIITFNNYKLVYKKLSLFDYSDLVVKEIIQYKNNAKLKTDNIINLFSYDNIIKTLDPNKITNIYVTGKKITHLIYNKNVYIAVYNSYAFDSDKNIYNEIYYRDSYNISWLETYKFVESLVSVNPVFIIYDKNLENIVDIENINPKTKVIGMQISTLYFWFSDTNISDINVNNFGVEIINFEPSDINSLLKNTHKVKNYITENIKDINFKIYYNNMFKIYKIATYNHILNTFKNPIKNDIINIINNKKFDDNINTNMFDITKMLTYKQDVNIIIPIINNYKNGKINKIELIENIKNNQFLFDLENIKKFSKMDIKDIKDYLYSEGKKYIKLVKKTDLKLDKNISNVITACIPGTKSEFCDNKKSLILENQYNDFVDVMAHNLHNETYSYYDIVNINFNIIVDYFKFNKNPGEIIYLLS
jgi:hypothetical protein